MEVIPADDHDDNETAEIVAAINANATVADTPAEAAASVCVCLRLYLRHHRQSAKTSVTYVMQLSHRLAGVVVSAFLDGWDATPAVGGIT